MAHNLNFDAQGNASFFSVKEKAWHGLGTIVDNYPSSEEALKLAGLDFTVEKRKMFIAASQDSDNLFIPEIEVPNYASTVRTDNDEVLGVVGSRYHIVQNVDAFRFFDSIVGDTTGILYETAGALGKGETIFITAKLPSYIQVGKNDLIEQYLFLTNSHDGSKAITVGFTPIRIVCNNTLNAALSRTENQIKIRHSANANSQLDIAHKVLGITNNLSGLYNECFNRMASVRITDKHLRDLIAQAMAPNKETLDNVKAGKLDENSTRFLNTVNKVYAYALSSPTQQMDTTKGTVFGAYNAITGFFQNVKSYKTQEDKLESLMFGSAAIYTQKAFNICSQLIKNDSFYN